MSDNKMFESLEERRLMAGRINVGPNVVYLNAVKGETATYALRITNTGDNKLLLTSDALRIKGDDRYNFKVLDFPSTGISFRPGRQVNLTVQFEAFSGDAAEIKDAYLRIESNDPKKPVAKIPLRGLVTAGEGGSSEPSTQKILNLFNLGINTGQTDLSNYLFPTNPSTPNDEVVVQRFEKLNADAPVIIKPLAVFGNNSDPGIRMGYYTPGNLDSEKYLWYVPGSTTQSVAPLVYGQTSFNPGSAAFGIVTEYPNFSNTDASVRKVYQEDTLNKTWDTNMSRHMRFYAYKDARGDVVPGTYIGIQEEYTQQYDFNDTVFIITNVKPAAAQPALSYENLSGYPGNDWLVFNKLLLQDEFVGNITRTSNTLRIRNSGSADLLLSTAITGDFGIASGGGSNIAIAPGASRDLKIDFTATGSQTNHPGTLTLTTNDPNQPTVQIHLEGYWQTYSEFMSPSNRASSEPSSAMIVNKLFGYTTIIPSTSQLNNTGIIEQLGDEILAQTFKIADSSARVRVTEIAAFHGQWYEDAVTLEKFPTNSFIGWYKPGAASGTTILTDEHVAGQMILPPKIVNNALGNYTSPIAAGTFNPGSANQEFGFVVENKEWSQYSRNEYTPDIIGDTRPANFGQFLRWFPLYGRDGALVPNTYVMLHDYNREFTNYDFNDNVYIISNIIPVNAVKTVKTANIFKTDDGRNRIIFTAPTDGPTITGFNIYRSTSGRGTYELLNSEPLARRAVTTFTDDTPIAGETNYYRIVALGENDTQSQPLTVKI